MTGLRKWFERRFWDFRYGHGTYLAYAIGLFNFITINYYLLISNVPFLSRIFTNLWVFALTFTLIYFPVAVIVGWLVYRKRQFKTDAEVAARENPYLFRAVVPSRETVLGLPMQKELVTMLMDIAEELGRLPPARKQRVDHYLKLIDRLLKGESIEK